MDYLKVEELKPYYTYRIRARNGRVGIWRPETGEFTLRRTKFNDVFWYCQASRGIGTIPI
jgi:hypothetical protein